MRPPSARPAVAIVHDYLTQRGGAERVVLSMTRAFPDAPVYTSLYEPDATFPEFADVDVRPLWTNNVAALRSDHRRGLLLYPIAFGRATVDADVTICSSSGFAHGVRATGRKIVYCHTPPRWLYEQAGGYVASWPAPVRAALRIAAPRLRHWDRAAAASADLYLANSRIVAERIRTAYACDAEVVPPPVPSGLDGPQERVPGIEPSYFLTVGRLLPYKNVDVVARAFRSLPDERLVIVGDGPDLIAVAEAAAENVTMLAQVSDAQLRWLYANCQGAVSASYEDFGLMPIEAATFGKPVAVLRFGGFLDTVSDGENGVFFDEPSASAVERAIARLLARSWDTDAIRTDAGRFSETAFNGVLSARAKSISGSRAPAGELR